MLNRRPDFFVIGGMKCGTTSLWHYLAKHPELVASRTKEPCYFSYNHRQGYLWYLEQFPPMLASRGKRTFDASPVYLHDPASAARLHARFPDAKLVVITRDPIARAISHYHFYSNPQSRFAERNRPSKLDRRTMEQAFADDMAGREERTFYRYCHVSRYHEQLQPFLRLYAPSRLHILDSDDLKRNPGEALAGLLTFLEVPQKRFFDGFEMEGGHVRGEASLTLEGRRTPAFQIFNSLEYDASVSPELQARMTAWFRDDVMGLRTLGASFGWMDAYTGPRDA